MFRGLAETLFVKASKPSEQQFALVSDISTCSDWVSGGLVAGLDTLSVSEVSDDLLGNDTGVIPTLDCGSPCHS